MCFSHTSQRVFVSRSEGEPCLPPLIILTLFPQPDDRGTINDVSVLRVTRRGAQADHFTQTPLTPGTEVRVRVDWGRRFDHMQQHSGRCGGHGRGAGAVCGGAVTMEVWFGFSGS